ncbi:Sporulation and spore germination [Arcanobacterium phocae]|uniref:Sporulation and spore germination n=1 Tax=Arcanobacterium phocae TaxID=131112 RepID=A0A1H2LFX7_9ACTO|nr:LpqB family beta-propeller domain-containing protein [Arcanobacterium phocae]SDU79306.1 Sporulation and spore germination [Arcanobacterium phocae]
MKKIVVLIACILMLTSCAYIPTSGSPHAVERPKQTGGGIVLDPQGPAEGADPEDIVVGFMRASSAGFSDDFVVARQYLTASVAKTWNPTTQVRIYPDSQNQQVSQTRSGAYRVTVGAGGSLDSTGRYTAATADATLSNEFSLVRERSGEWRIAVVPDGVTMPESLFQTLFVRTPLYFPTQDQQALVTDVRWYPRSQVVSAASRGLVDGPSAWLAGSVTTLLPSGTRLNSPAVNVEGGVARIDLSSDVAELSPHARSILYAQFYQTLTAVAGISGVEISANGALIGNSKQVDISTYPYSGSDLLVLANGKPALVKDDGIHVISNSEALANLDLSSLATPYGEFLTEFAAVGSDGRTLYRISMTGQVDTLLSGTAFVTPSIDRDDFIWAVERSAERSVKAVALDSGQTFEVAVPWLEGLKVRAIAVSREGARLAVVVDHDGVSQILIGGIVRNSSGVPQSVTEPIRVGQRLVDVTDLSWISSTRLVVIGKSQTASINALYSVPLGENISVMSSLEDMTSVTAGRNDESILLQTIHHDVYAYDAGGWRKVLEDVTMPTYPG